MTTNGRIDFICFGGIDWWYHNRGHMDTQLMRRFAKKGNLLFVNSIVMSKPNLSERHKLFAKVVRKAKSIFAGLKRVDEGFWVYSPFSIPIQHLNWARPINESLLKRQILRVKRKVDIVNPIVWTATPVVCELALKLSNRKLVYQRTDRFENFPGVDADLITRFDRKLKAHADITIFVNTSLYEQEKQQCKNALYLDHGVDFDTFSTAGNDPEEPTDLAEIPGYRVGFFGSIDDCNPDIAFMEQVVDLVPDMSFVFVGQALCDCSALAMKENVWMLGKKAYEQIPHYGKCFDVLLLPLKQDDWSAAVNPAKLKEYLALGKPVVSTPFPELKKYSDVVYEAASAQDFADLIRSAIAWNNEELVAQRQKRVEKFSWDSKANTVLQELTKEESKGKHE